MSALTLIGRDASRLRRSTSRLIQEPSESVQISRSYRSATTAPAVKSIVTQSARDKVPTLSSLFRPQLCELISRPRERPGSRCKAVTAANLQRNQSRQGTMDARGNVVIRVGTFKGNPDDLSLSHHILVICCYWGHIPPLRLWHFMRFKSHPWASRPDYLSFIGRRSRT